MKTWCASFCLLMSLSATTVLPMSVERLTQASTDVVVARAEESWTEWNPTHTLLHTITRFRISDLMKGKAQSTILVRQMGGRADGIEQKVSGVRGWRQGEEAVLFLRPSHERVGAYAVTGLMQGNFRVVREGKQAYVSNGVSGIRAVKGSKAQSFSRITLQELQQRVRAASSEAQRR